MKTKYVWQIIQGNTPYVTDYTSNIIIVIPEMRKGRQASRDISNMYFPKITHTVRDLQCFVVGWVQVRFLH